MKQDRVNKDIEGQLRLAILESPMSRYRISQLSGVADSALCYFVNGQRTLNLTSAARVAEVLGLELKPVGKE
ncbi:hypothetical protein ACQ9LF_05670 [Anaerohalosphaeraceae bacterium U12dextr]